MFGLISRNVPRSLWGQTALMLVVLAVVLAVLRAEGSNRLPVTNGGVPCAVGEASITLRTRSSPALSFTRPTSISATMGPAQELGEWVKTSTYPMIRGERRDVGQRVMTVGVYQVWADVEVCASSASSLSSLACGESSCTSPPARSIWRMMG